MSSERAEQPATPPMQGVPGRTLATQREAMGWSVEQVADQLKLAVRQVVALEAGDYASLPSPAVTRGFVRAYAKILKLDPVPLVAMIEMDTPAPSEGERTIRRDRPASFSEVRFPSHGKRAALPLGWIAGAVLVLAAGVVTWKFDLIPSLSGSAAPGDAEQAAVLAPTATGTAPASGAQDTMLNPSVPLISVPPPAAPEGAASTSTGTPAGVGPAVAGVGPAPTTAAPAATAAPAPGANALVLNVREDSWVEVRAGKKKLMGRMLKAGSTETIDVTEEVTVIVGKPGGVSATLRGAALELPQVPGKTFARVTLK